MQPRGHNDDNLPCESDDFTTHKHVLATLDSSLENNSFTLTAMAKYIVRLARFPAKQQQLAFFVPPK